MFTGIIQHVGAITDVRSTGDGRRLTIDIGPLADGLSLGDSVAVNGVCLTASTIDGPRGQFDVVAESLTRSTLGDLRAGAKVNLERALRADAGLDGHIVQGHVDETATVKAIRRGQAWTVEFAADKSLIDLMVPKGSVAIDGVSLTLAGVDATANTFAVALIPTTLAETTLTDLAAGGTVNIETDILGKYVRRYLQQMLTGDSNSPGSLTIEKLRNAGFA
ncbi:MAG: riboflavin synthase [Phycisphaerae bacterium]|nr:riboflavin synthase [Phycisphaerae bacterium]